MPMMQLSRQQRRALERYAHGVDVITASDKRWFEEHPHRHFRIRRMAAAEIGSVSALKTLKPVPEGKARFTLVRKMSPNARLRIFIYGLQDRSGNETTDAVGAALWSHHLDRDADGRERELAIATIIADHDHQDTSDG